jgi:hypothetical protein
VVVVFDVVTEVKASELIRTGAKPQPGSSASSRLCACDDRSTSTAIRQLSTLDSNCEDTNTANMFKATRALSMQPTRMLAMQPTRMMAMRQSPQLFMRQTMRMRNPVPVRLSKDRNYRFVANNSNRRRSTAVSLPQRPTYARDHELTIYSPHRFPASPRAQEHPH